MPPLGRVRLAKALGAPLISASAMVAMPLFVMNITGGSIVSVGTVVSSVAMVVSGGSVDSVVSTGRVSSVGTVVLSAGSVLSVASVSAAKAMGITPKASTRTKRSEILRLSAVAMMFPFMKITPVENDRGCVDDIFAAW